MNSDADSAREQAIRLAQRGYSVLVALDEVSDTGHRIYLARALDLPGCLAQGYTPQEARESLSEVITDYIESLIEDGLPVPEPRLLLSRSSPYPKVTTVRLNYDAEVVKDATDTPESRHDIVREGPLTLEPEAL